MIPVLIDNSKTLSDLVTDKTNGLGRLSDCISCKCVEARNGEYTLTFEYPVTGTHYKDLSVNGLIRAKASDHAGNQIFRINHISREMGGTVEVTCNHISYDLAKTSVAPFTATGAASAFTKLKSNMTGGSAFSFGTDISNTTSKFANKLPQSARALLGGQDGSLLDIYGGEYDFDNLTVKLLANRGNDRGVTIKYGKNLTDLKQEESLSDMYTAVMPYVRQSDDTVIVGTLQTILNVSDDNVKILNLDLSSEFQGTDDSTPTADDIDAKAQEYINANELSTPKVTLTVSAVDLSKTVEYKSKQAEQIDLCDTVNVSFDELGVNAKAKVTKITYNVLTEMNDSYEIGNAKSTLAGTIAGISGSVSKAEQQAVSTTAAMIASMTALILGGLGGHMIVGTNADGQPNELYFMDTTDKSTAKYVLRENMNGIGFSKTGYDGPFTTAWTIDGKFNADFISGLTIIGNSIDGASITGTDITGSTISASLFKLAGSTARIVSGSGLPIISTKSYDDGLYIYARNSSGKGGRVVIETGQKDDDDTPVVLINNTQSNGIPVVSYSKGRGSENIGTDHAYALEWGGNAGKLVLAVHVDDQTPVKLDNGHFGSPVPVYRLSNPNDSNSHMFTIDDNERSNLVNNGWKDEGIGFYAMSTPR